MFKQFPKKDIVQKMKNSNCQYTRKYFIGEQKICKGVFFLTLQINQRRVNTALNKKKKIK